jgi:hypothetical protein
MRHYIFLLLAVTLQATPTPIAAVSSTAATASLQPCSGQLLRGKITLVLKGADSATQLSGELKLPDDSATDVKISIPDSSLKAGEIKTVGIDVTVPGCKVPSSGILILRAGDGVLPYSVWFKVLSKSNCDSISNGSDWARLAFVCPLALAVGIGFVSAWVVRKELTRRMGAPKWDFSSSWATNITLGGGLLGGILGFSLFPENGHYLSKSGYLAASIVFPVLAGLAPQAYNIFRKPIADPTDPAAMPLQGFVTGFVVAAALTAWAAIGQAATTALAISEIYCSGYLDSSLAWPIVGLLLLLSFGLTVYVVSTVAFTVKHQITQADKMARLAADAEPPIPNWRIL